MDLRDEELGCWGRKLVTCSCTISGRVAATVLAADFYLTSGHADEASGAGQKGISCAVFSGLWPVKLKQRGISC